MELKDLANKEIEIEGKDFKELIKYVLELKEELNKCKEYNNFLNKQIKEYNKKYKTH